MIKAKLLCQLARAPVGGSIARSAAGVVQNMRVQGGAVFVRRSAAMAGVKSSQTLANKAPFPAADVGSVLAEIDSATTALSAWGTWLERRPQHPRRTSSPEAEDLTKRLRRLRTKQQQVIEQGHVTRSRFDHLSPVKAFVEETWSKTHPNECPTCSADYSRQGGILSIINSQLQKVTSERDFLRATYLDQQAKLNELQKSSEHLKQAPCPVTEEEQTRLVIAFQSLIPSKANFADWITVRNQREELLEVARLLRQMPAVPSPVSAEREADQVVATIISQFQSADRTFEAPNNWKPVRDRLTKMLAEIVNEHLPNTLAKLWCELTLNLTSAPWLLPARPCIDVVSRRGEQKSTVRVKGRLARYLFNQSEIHILGLAWFFVRYLTHSRFYHASIVMDEPAHELDQTSFRDLCRLWETIVRLHRVYERPLKLLIMLNQESRAVEAARATGGILEVLGWTREQDEFVEATRVIGEGFFAPQPITLFRTDQTLQARS